MPISTFEVATDLRRSSIVSCAATMEKIAARVGRVRLAEAAGKDSSISVNGSTGSPVAALSRMT